MLELQRVHVAADDLESLLCKCPALERLALNTCGPFVSLRIGHQLHRLEHLSLGSSTLVENLQINAINLKTISHGYNIRKIVVGKDSQITEVIANMNTVPGFRICIGYKDTLQYIFTGLPSALPCLEKLSLHIYENIQVCSSNVAFLVLHFFLFCCRGALPLILANSALVYRNR
jgi:hypothetical protein